MIVKPPRVRMQHRNRARHAVQLGIVFGELAHGVPTAAQELVIDKLLTCARRVI